MGMKNVLLSMLVMVGVAHSVGGATASDVLARLKSVAESPRYYWAWTHTWTDPFEPGDRSMETDYTASAGGRCALIHYSDLAIITGTWHTPEWYQARRKQLTDAICRHWREHGAIPVFSWHMDHPYCTNEFPKASYRYKSDGADRNVVRQILEGTGGPCGTDTIVSKNGRKPFPNPRAWFDASLREIADFFNGLDDGQGGKVPVIMRYGHECDGDWFWWGRTWCTPAEFKALSRLTADYLRRACGRDQILFAYTPDRTWTDFGKEGEEGHSFLTWYPGRDYVDIVGFDDYSIGQGDDATVAKSFAETVRKLRLVTSFAKANGLVAALTECGGRNKRDDFWVWVHRLMTADGVSCAFVDTWRGPYGMIPDTARSAQDELTFARRPEVLMEDSRGAGFR